MSYWKLYLIEISIRKMVIPPVLKAGSSGTFLNCILKMHLRFYWYRGQISKRKTDKSTGSIRITHLTVKPEYDTVTAALAEEIRFRTLYCIKRVINAF